MRHRPDVHDGGDDDASYPKPPSSHRRQNLRHPGLRRLRRRYPGLSCPHRRHRPETRPRHRHHCHRSQPRPACACAHDHRDGGDDAAQYARPRHYPTPHQILRRRRRLPAQSRRRTRERRAAHCCHWPRRRPALRLKLTSRDGEGDEHGPWWPEPPGRVRRPPPHQRQERPRRRPRRLTRRPRPHRREAYDGGELASRQGRHPRSPTQETKPAQQQTRRPPA